MIISNLITSYTDQYSFRISIANTYGNTTIYVHHLRNKKLTRCMSYSIITSPLDKNYLRLLSHI